MQPRFFYFKYQIEILIYDLRLERVRAQTRCPTFPLAALLNEIARFRRDTFFLESMLLMLGRYTSLRW